MTLTRRLLVLIVLLNVVDAIATATWVGMGASEANPIMAFYLHMGVGYFYAVKAGLILIPVMMLWSQAEREIVKRVTPVLTAVYVSVLAIHWRGVLLTW